MKMYVMWYNITNRNSFLQALDSFFCFHFRAISLNNLRPNQLFQIWPPETVSIVDALMVPTNPKIKCNYVCTSHYPFTVIIMQTYLKVLNMLVMYILLSVCLRLSALSQFSYMQFMCVSSLPISFVNFARILSIYLIVISKSEKK